MTPNASYKPHDAAPTHLPILDGVRGFAATLVVVSHCGNAGLLPGYVGHGTGQIGVCLFYALSGFLMGYLYLGRSFTGAEVRQYAISRGARVLPLFYLVLAIAVVLLLVFGRPDYGIHTWRDFLGNAFMLKGTSVLWSIPVEIHFYAVFVGLWWAWSRGKMMFVAVLGVLLAVQGVLAVTIWKLTGGSLRFVLPFWLHFFVFGMLLAQVYRRYHRVFAALAQKRAVHIATWALLIAVLVVPPDFRRALGVPVLPVFADPLSAGWPMLVLVAALIGAGPMQWFRGPLWVWLGAMSYAIYLIHIPVVRFVEQQGFAFDTFFGFGFVLVALGTAALAFALNKLLELPAQVWIKGAFARRVQMA